MNIFSAMKPNLVVNRALDIDVENLKNRGITCFLLDFDNTLGPDHATEPIDYSFECIKKFTDNGFKCCLVSNARSSRSAGIAQALGIPCVTYAHKPNPDGIYRAAKLMDVSLDKCVMVGDQIFTDVIAGRLAGVYTIMTERYGKKEIWYVVLKRFFEKVVRLIGRF